MLTVPTPNGITGIDPANAIIVTARGLAGSTLHSTEDGILAVDMLPDELTAALDEALFGAESEQTLWTSPLDATDWPSSIYVAGWQVRSAQPSHGGGCTVAFQGGALQVTIPSLSVAELTDEIGTTSPPWSAGGGSGVELAETFEPEVESLQEDLTVTVGPNANAKWGVVRLASTNSEEQDMFILSGWFELQSADDITTAPLFNVDLPYQMAPSTIAASVEARDAGSSDAPLAVSVSVTSLTQLRVHGSIANGQVAVGYVWAMFQGTIAE